jgi:hypothetical protein
MSYLTEAEFIFKTEYTDDKLGEHTERDHILFAKLAKKKGMGGEDFRYPVRYGNPQGISGDFATAQRNAAKSKGVQFAAEPVLKYGVIQIDGPSLQRASGSKSAFYDLVTMETDGGLEEMGDRAAFDLYRSGNGMRGRRLSASGNVITLTRADDARNFKQGMTVMADDTITGASPRTGVTTVAAVDEDNAKITLTSAAAIAAFADNDYLFAEGDPGTCVDGLELLYPLTAPTSGDSFRGRDRSADVRRLAGVRSADTAAYPEEVIGLLAVKIANNGKRCNAAYINPINHFAMSKRLNAKVEYDGGGGEAEVFFQYITIHTTAGMVKVYSDADCPIDRVFVGHTDWLFYRFLGDELIHIIRDDGKTALRQGAADGIESRLRMHSNTIHPLPGCWGIGQLA